MRARLEKALLAEAYIRLRRVFDSSALSGFVVGLSNEWVLLHIVDGDTITFNGYEVVRLKDITSVSEPGGFVPRALRWRRERPASVPDVLLEDIQGLLSSANSHFPLVALYQEKEKDDTLVIGRVERLGRKKVTLAEIDTRAAWRNTHKYRYDAITRITLGDGYLAALWEVGAQGWRERQSEKRKEKSNE